MGRRVTTSDSPKPEKAAHKLVTPGYIFEDLGFNWGGDFLIPDGMHFEYGGGPLAGES